MHFHPQHRRHGVDLVTRWNCPHHGASPAPVFFEVVKTQRQHLVRRDPGPVLVDHPEAVGVAVQTQPELCPTAQDITARLGHPFGIRFRMATAE